MTGAGDGGGGGIGHLLPLTFDCCRAALLASYGYVTLALAFYGLADLPSLYDSFDLNYFQLAADWLLAQPQVRGARLGLYGSSTGGPAQHSRQLKDHHSRLDPLFLCSKP